MHSVQYLHALHQATLAVLKLRNLSHSLLKKVVNTSRVLNTFTPQNLTRITQGVGMQYALKERT